MTEYVKSTNFASKDALAVGNPLKIVKGTEIDTEFNNIAVAVTTKADLLSPVFTGTPTAPTAATGTSTTQLATTAFATAAISPFTGAMLMWPTATAPSGFLLCNGQTVSRSTYAALFAILGVVFGSGDGSTTFTLPDYRNKTVLGAGDLYAAAATGGSKDAVVVGHTHTGTTASAGAASGTLNGYGPLGTFYNSSGVFSTSSPQIDGTQGAGGRGGDNQANLSIPAHTHTITTDSTGVSGTGANLPPYLGVYFIIKT